MNLGLALIREIKYAFTNIGTTYSNHKNGQKGNTLLFLKKNGAGGTIFHQSPCPAGPAVLWPHWNIFISKVKTSFVQRILSWRPLFLSSNQEGMSFLRTPIERIFA